MNRDFKFKIGQRVRTRDEDTQFVVDGVVTDTSGRSVFIKWEDSQNPVEHLQHEYEKIWLYESRKQKK